MLRQNSINRDPEFLRYLSAIMWVESGGDNTARSPKEAVGMLQVTQPAAEHAVQLCPALRGSVKHTTEWWSVSTVNIQVASCYLQYARRAGDSWVGALIIYNGGIRSLTRLNNGSRVPDETAHYVVSVLTTINQCY